MKQRNLDYIDWNWLQNPNSAIYREVEIHTTWQKAAIKSNQGVLERLRIEARNHINEIQTYLND